MANLKGVAQQDRLLGCVPTSTSDLVGADKPSDSWSKLNGKQEGDVPQTKVSDTQRAIGADREMDVFGNKLDLHSASSDLPSLRTNFLWGASDVLYYWTTSLYFLLTLNPIISFICSLSHTHSYLHMRTMSLVLSMHTIMRVLGYD